MRRPFLGLLLLAISCTGQQPPLSLPILQAPSTLPPPNLFTVEPPNAEGTAAAFLVAWEDSDYVGMYSLLSPLSQAAISQDEFSEQYESVVEAAALTSVETKILSSFQEVEKAQVQYQVSLRTALVGSLQREITMHLHFENGDWGISWDEGLILPELTGAKSLYMQYTIPARGNIYDRNGLAFAAYTDVVAIGVIPGNIDPAREASLLHELSRLIDRHPETIRAMYADAMPEWYIPIGEAAAEETQAKYELLSSFPGLVLNPYQARFYVGGPLSAPHAVGYIALISEDQVAYYRALGYRRDEFVGALGLEAWGEEYLAGERGGTLYVVGPGGDVIAELAKKKAAAAQSITTTLDREFQHEVQAALQDMAGAIVVLDIHTGEVLAMASAPPFDPNLFAPTNYNIVQLNEMLNNPYRPLVNRATQGQYAPGSTFKVVTVTGALESGLFTPEQIYFCGTTWTELGRNHVKYDWTYEKDLVASGNLDIVGAIRRSCNPWFYHIGLTLHNWADYYLPDLAMRFGLGAPSGIVGLRGAVNEEVGGLLPGPDWATEQGGTWTVGNSVNMAIGQGELSVTPLQMAMIYAAIGNGGTRYRPQLVLSIAAPGVSSIYTFEPEVIGQLPVSEETLEVIREGLWQVVNHKQGTAYWPFRGFGIPVYGKTGTTEDHSRRPHAWFVGFTEAHREDRPDIAIAVVLENRGEGSKWAAPIFRRVVEVHFYGQIDTLYPWESQIGLTATPLPTLTPTPAAHIVQPGDSLASIAGTYGVPLADVLAMNGIENANLLAVGQELIIPLGGLPPEGTPTPEGGEGRLPTAEPTSQP